MMKTKLYLVLLLCMSINLPTAKASNWESRQRMNEMPRRHYICYQTTSCITIDGKIDDTAWQNAPWTEYFIDIEGQNKPEPWYKTRAKMLWDDQYFYIAAQLEEPHVWGTLTKRDSVIFYDNDFEIFIDPNADTHQYYEIEINALNTLWDLFLHKPYKDGGPADNDWNIDSILTAVVVQGTLNANHDRDQGWSIEFAIPWSGFTYSNLVGKTPNPGDQWRINFSRVEWLHLIENNVYKKIPGKKEENWVWSPQGIVDMHRPEKWGILQFTDAEPGKTEFQPDETMPARKILFDLYYQQRDYHQKHKNWADSIEALNQHYNNDHEWKQTPQIKLTDKGYKAWLTIETTNGTKKKVTIQQDAKLEVQPIE